MTLQDAWNKSPVGKAYRYEMGKHIEWDQGHHSPVGSTARHCNGTCWHEDARAHEMMNDWEPVGEE